MTANRILQMNGTATALTAIAMLAARSILYPLFGLESPLLVDATAVGFLAYATALIVVARRPQIGRGSLVAFAAGDALYVAASIVMVVAFWSRMTPIARTLIIATAFIVEIFATLQYRASKQLGASRGFMIA
jgi:hypothetical protein